MSTWPLKSDEDVLAAASRLFDYTEEGEQQIRAELARRELAGPPPSVGRCTACGRSIAANHPIGECRQCGVPLGPAIEDVLKARVSQEPPIPASRQMDTTRLGGWLLVLAITLAASVAFQAVNLIQALGLFRDVAAAGYAGFFGFALVVELAVFILAVIALVRLNALRRSTPAFLVMFFSIRPIASALLGLVALSTGAQLFAEEFGRDAVRGALAAAIWIPYLKMSRRVKLTFVR